MPGDIGGVDVGSRPLETARAGGERSLFLPTPDFMALAREVSGVGVNISILIP